MTSFFERLKNQSSLGLDEHFSDVDNVESALRDTFLSLANALNPAFDPLDQTVIFSVDTFNEALVGIMNQPDNFAQQVSQHLGTPNAKICHLRLYAPRRGAHWHALFGQMNEKGELEKIIITDSLSFVRQNKLQGATAQYDMEKNSFLKKHRDKIEFIPGLKQPPKSGACWIYALANLAALASTGKVYKRQRQIGGLGQEIISLRNKYSSKLRTSPSPSFFPPQENKQSTKKKVFIYAGGITLLATGVGFTLVGILALTPVLPLSFTAGIALLAVGLAMLLASAAMTYCCLKNRENEKMRDSLEEPSERIILI